MYLTCSKKLMGSLLSPPHGTNKGLERETKNKMTSVICRLFVCCYVVAVAWFLGLGLILVFFGVFFVTRASLLMLVFG